MGDVNNDLLVEISIHALREEGDLISSGVFEKE